MAMDKVFPHRASLVTHFSQPGHKYQLSYHIISWSMDWLEQCPLAPIVSQKPINHSCQGQEPSWDISDLRSNCYKVETSSCNQRLTGLVRDTDNLHRALIWKGGSMIGIGKEVQMDVWPHNSWRSLVKKASEGPGRTDWPPSQKVLAEVPSMKPLYFPWERKH